MKGKRYERAGWQVDHIHLHWVTRSKGISGNGLPPRNGWQFRIRKDGRHVGYTNDTDVLVGIIGIEHAEGVLAMMEESDGNATRRAS